MTKMLCAKEQRVLRSRKNKNIFHNTCAGKQTALQDQRIYKRASVSIVAPTSRSRRCNSGSEKGLKKSEVNLNSAPFNVNLGQYLAQKTNDLHILKLIGFFSERA